MTLPHASLHIIDTLSEAAVTLRIDLSYVKLYLSVCLDLERPLGQEMQLTCKFRRFYHTVYMPGVHLTNSHIFLFRFFNVFFLHKES